MASAAGTTNAMDIVFRHVRQFIVDHMGQLLNIQAAGCYVGGNQNTDVAILESGQGLSAGTLALIAVDRCGVQAVQFKLLGKSISAVFGSGKNQNLLPIIVPN